MRATRQALDTTTAGRSRLAARDAVQHLSLRARVKGIVERSLGVTISRTPPIPVNGHADAALRELRQWSPDDVVFDVGANDGRTILRLQPQLSGPRFYAFEPVSSTYRILQERTGHLPNVRTLRLALGAAAGTGLIHLNPIHAMDSFSPRWTTSQTGTETVRISTVDEVLEAERIALVHFLKIDTEGYELEVLRGAERSLRASRILIVQVEVGVDQMTRPFVPLETARTHMAERGYFLYGLYNQCRTPAFAPRALSAADDSYRPEVLGYCDALFIRADLACQGESSSG
ncbi:MAG TPA: FkbM family methyltransferase [Vicinamibacterales bacterium]|nr:FkbM family methyltransferase [Vicinamibacterales bacterium]